MRRPRATTAAVSAALTCMIIALAGACSAATPPSPAPTLASPVASGPSGAGPSTVTTPPTPAATESNPPGDIPDDQVYLPFTTGGASPVTVKVPEGWSRSTVAGATVFTDKLNQIQIAVARSTAAPTVDTVTTVDLPQLKATVSQFGGGVVSQVTRAQQSAVLLRYDGDSAQDPVTGKVIRNAFERYTFAHNGYRLDLTLVGPSNADNVDPWRIVSDSVRWG